MLALLRVARHLVGGFGRRGVGVAESQPADLAGRGQVSLEEGGRQVLHVRDVVEARAHRLARQVGRRIDLQAQQVFDGALVFGAVEALEGAGAGVGVLGGRRVDVLLHRGDEGDDLVFRRTTDTGRRHHPRPELADHLLGDGRVRGRVRRVEFLQGEVAQEPPLVVAADAVSLHEIVVGGAGYGHNDTIDGPEGAVRVRRRLNPGGDGHFQDQRENKYRGDFGHARRRILLAVYTDGYCRRAAGFARGQSGGSVQERRTWSCPVSADAPECGRTYPRRCAQAALEVASGHIQWTGYPMFASAESKRGGRVLHPRVASSMAAGRTWCRDPMCIESDCSQPLLG